MSIQLSCLIFLRHHLEKCFCRLYLIPNLIFHFLLLRAFSAKTQQEWISPTLWRKMQMRWHTAFSAKDTIQFHPLIMVLNRRDMETISQGLKTLKMCQKMHKNQFLLNKKTWIGLKTNIHRDKRLQKTLYRTWTRKGCEPLLYAMQQKDQHKSTGVKSVYKMLAKWTPTWVMKRQWGKVVE